MLAVFAAGIFVGTRLPGRGLGNVQQRLREVERDAYERGRAYEQGVQEGRREEQHDEPIDVHVLPRRS